MSAADLYGGCPGCGVKVDPNLHDCFTPPPVVADSEGVEQLHAEVERLRGVLAAKRDEIERLRAHICGAR